MPIRPRFLGLISLVALCAVTAPCQQVGGISGLVADSSGSVISGVRVTATNEATGAVFTAETTSAGVYTLAALPVGRYTLVVSKSGFATVKEPSVIININSALTLNITMTVGSISQSVTVTGAPPMIDTENSELGNYRFTEQLQNMPLIVREVQTLVGQTPGIPYGTGDNTAKVAADTDTVGGTFNPGGRSAMQVISDGTQLNSFQTTGYPAIDGIQRRADLPVPNLDTISQFKLVTNGSSAEYMSPVAMVIATKSGANSFHGSAYYFNQSGGLSAHVWSITNPQSYVRQQVGGGASGPIKRDKLFFAATAEGFSFDETSNTNVRWPTQTELSGNLSELLNPAATGLKTPEYIYDPQTGQPFNNNQISTTRFSPVTQVLLKLIPAAPQPATLTAFNAVSTKPEYDQSQKYDGRVDWTMNPKNSIFFRTTIAHINQASAFSGTVPGNYGFSVKNYETEVYTGAYTHTLGPSSLFKITVSHRSEPFQNTPTDGGSVFSPAITSVTPKPPFAGPPAVVENSDGAGISDLVDRHFLNWSQDNDFQLSPMYLKTFRTHDFTAGVFFMHGNKSEAFAAPPWGTNTVQSNYNTSPTKYSSAATSATGDAFADYLLGLPEATNVTVGTAGANLSKITWSLWAQDDWRVTPKLTINLGLRYDRLGGFYPTDGRGTNVDFATGQVVIPEGSQSKINSAFQPYTGQLITTSQAGVANTFIDPDNLGFAPRFGFAYRLRPDFVIRGGAGIYDNDFNYSVFSSIINNPPFTYNAKLTRSLLVSNGVDVNDNYTFQNPSANGSPAAAASAFAGITGFNPRYKIQRAYEFNLTLEKQFGLYAVTASYVGNIGNHLDREVLVNACPPGPTLCTAVTAGTSGARKWTQFGINFGQFTGSGRSDYNALNLEASRHFQNGILLDANYSWDKLLGYQYVATNPVVSPNWHYDWGPISNQPYQVFHFNYVYAVPFGNGQKFASHLNAFGNLLVSGWKLSGVGTWEAGQPLTVLAGTGFSPTDATSNRANRTCGGGLRHKTLGEWFDTSCYSAPALINPSAPSATQEFGTAGIGTVIGPRWFSYDMNLQKPIKIRENATLSLRIDALNVFNHPDYTTPDLTVSDGALFGTVRAASPAYIPRSFQFGARFDF